MLCERCQQRPAVVHVTQIVNNNKIEMHLCEQCARDVKSQTFGFYPQLNLHSFLTGLLNYDFGGNRLTGSESIDRCETCGLPEETFIKSGLLGCSKCYDYFEARIRPLLKHIQGTDKHTGKVPQRTGGNARLGKEIEQLKAKLQQAVAAEEFEKAAQFRDHIRELEGKLNG